MTVTIRHGDCREVLRTLPDQSVHCCVTSPPYFGLRDYGHAGQIGLEATPDAFVAELVDVFRELRRVLRDDGTLWLNLGDSYAGGGRGGGADWSKQTTNVGALLGAKKAPDGFKPKDLIGIPWRVAFALQADGWYLRQDIIWSKPNPMPESVTDRCTKAHEYIFLLSKSARYFYDADAIKQQAAPASFERLGQNIEGQKGSDRVPGKTNGPMKAVFGGRNKHEGYGTRIHSGNEDAGNYLDAGVNRRSVWEVATQPFKDAHFATFPPDLIEPCIKAGCPEHTCAKCAEPWVRDIVYGEPDKQTTRGKQPWTAVTGQRDAPGGLPRREIRSRGFIPSCDCDWAYTAPPGVVLDPFGGAGTTGLVADRLGRDAILIELNPEYAAMADRRIRGDGGMFAEVQV